VRSIRQKRQTVQLHSPGPQLRNEPLPIRFARAAAAELPATVAARAHSYAPALDELETETLMLNLDASLRVYQRAHFFSWTQGLLQGLIPHEVLICALRSGAAPSMRAESFSMIAPRQAIFGETFLRDDAGAQNLVKEWQDGGFRPLIRDAADGPFAKGLFARELEHVGATQVLAHGTHDADGLANSFYAFLCAAGTLGPRHAYLARLVTPFVHDAWVRTEVNARAPSIDGPRTGETARITGREQEVLGWVARGKSNFEIGAILVISPLTVKNHVQKILRKLDVVNRAQAVGKALELRILRA
jgi:transcriptional regulator EpsA